MGVRGDGNNNDLHLGGRSVNTDGFQQHNRGNTFLAATDYRVGGYFDVGGDEINSYLDGVAGTPTAVTFGNATYANETPSVDNTIGTNGAGNTQFFDGIIAEFGVWNVKLNAAEFSALGAKHVSPELVRRSSLVGYWKLFGNASPEPDRILGANGVLVNAPTKATHPRIIYPAPTRIIHVPAAVTTSPWYAYANQ